MSLTAMLRSREIFCPSERIAAGEPREEVYTEITRIKRSLGLFCCECYELSGDLLPVTYVDAKAVRVHFRHIGESECVTKRTGSKESDRHKITKLIVARHFRQELSDQDVSVEVDLVRYQSEGVRDRKPDVVVVYPNSAREAHEIQYSKITLEEIIERTQDLLAHGFFKVVWYLGEKLWKDRTIRAWLWKQQKTGGKVFHFILEYSEEPLNATWSEDRYFNTKAEAARASSEAEKKRREEEQVARDRIRVEEEERQRWAAFPFERGQRVWYVADYTNNTIVESFVKDFDRSTVFLLDNSSHNTSLICSTKELVEQSVILWREKRTADKQRLAEIEALEAERKREQQEMIRISLEKQAFADSIRSEAAKIRGGVKTPLDQRQYLDALCETFAGLRSLLTGNWTQPEQTALLNLGKTAIAHGSAPMAQMFNFLCDRLGKTEWVGQEFTGKERSRLEFLSWLGKVS